MSRRAWNKREKVALLEDKSDDNIEYWAIIKRMHDGEAYDSDAVNLNILAANLGRDANDIRKDKLEYRDVLKNKFKPSKRATAAAATSEIEDMITGAMGAAASRDARQARGHSREVNALNKLGRKLGEIMRHGGTVKKKKRVPKQKKVVNAKVGDRLGITDSEGVPLPIIIKVIRDKGADADGKYFVGVVEATDDDKYKIGQRLKFRRHNLNFKIVWEREDTQEEQDIMGGELAFDPETQEVKVGSSGVLASLRQKHEEHLQNVTREKKMLDALPPDEGQAAINVSDEICYHIEYLIASHGLHKNDTLVGAEGITKKNWIALAVTPTRLWTIWVSDRDSARPVFRGETPTIEQLTSPDPQAVMANHNAMLSNWKNLLHNYYDKYMKGSATGRKILMFTDDDAIDAGFSGAHRLVFPEIPDISDVDISQDEPEPNEIDNIASQMG